MAPAALPAAAPPADADARTRLLHAGLRLFAAQGFAKTSTRELADAAQVNVAAISYYFGDKAGLYRAVFFGPLGSPADDLARFADTTLPLSEALTGFYEAFIAPLRQGDAARQCMKLHVREMLEPTGLWDEEVREGIGPMHEALVALLCRHLDTAPDADVRRLAVLLAGLGVHLHIGRDVIDAVAPDLHAAPDAFDRWHEALVRSALAMVEAERQRRRPPRPPAPVPPAGDGPDH
jgi:AcrR family transcriptional regulator